MENVIFFSVIIGIISLSAIIAFNLRKGGHNTDTIRKIHR